MQSCLRAARRIDAAPEKSFLHCGWHPGEDEYAHPSGLTFVDEQLPVTLHNDPRVWAKPVAALLKVRKAPPTIAPSVLLRRLNTSSVVRAQAVKPCQATDDSFG